MDRARTKGGLTRPRFLLPSSSRWLVDDESEEDEEAFGVAGGTDGMPLVIGMGAAARVREMARARAGSTDGDSSSGDGTDGDRDSEQDQQRPHRYDTRSFVHYDRAHRDFVNDNLVPDMFRQIRAAERQVEAEMRQARRAGRGDPDISRGSSDNDSDSESLEESLSDAPRAMDQDGPEEDDYDDSEDEGFADEGSDEETDNETIDESASEGVPLSPSGLTPPRPITTLQSEQSTDTGSESQPNGPADRIAAGGASTDHPPSEGSPEPQPGRYRGERDIHGNYIVGELDVHGFPIERDADGNRIIVNRDYHGNPIYSDDESYEYNPYTDDGYNSEDDYDSPFFQSFGGVYWELKRDRDKPFDYSDFGKMWAMQRAWGIMGREQKRMHMFDELLRRDEKRSLTAGFKKVPQNAAEPSDQAARSGEANMDGEA